MQVSFNDVAQWFEGILSGTASREDAHRWSAEVVEADLAGGVDYAPAVDGPRILGGLTILGGVNATKPDGSFLYGGDDVRKFYDELRNDHDS